MVIDKRRAIASTGAEFCTAVDGSCLLQIGGRLSWSARVSVRCTWPRSWPRRKAAGNVPSRPFLAAAHFDALAELAATHEHGQRHCDDPE